MIKYHRLPKQIMSLLPKAKGYLEENPKVVFAYLFGGLTAGKSLPMSDVDIAVFLSGDVDYQNEKMEILRKLIDFHS